MKINYLFILVVAIAMLSGCIGGKDKIYSVEDVYQNPNTFQDNKGGWNTISIQGIVGTDPAYDVAPGKMYYLVNATGNLPPNEIIYVSAVNGIPKAGSNAVVKGKIDQVLQAGKLKIVTFIPVNQ
ncbi:MAG: hypothetical protein WCE94_08930 [Candidatus Methanoperedens sp.]